LADQAQAFYTAHPGDHRSGEARNIEIFALIEAREAGDTTMDGRLQGAVAQLRQNPSLPDATKVRGVAADKFTRAVRGIQEFDEQMPALVRAAREIIAEFPRQPQGYQAMLAVSQGCEDALAAELTTELLSSAAPEQIKAAAQEQVQLLALLGRKLDAFPGLAKLAAIHAGEPVLIYAWSMEHPGSLEVGRMVQARRFAAIAINMDEAGEDAMAVQHREGLGGEQIFADNAHWEALVSLLHLEAPGHIYLCDSNHEIVEVRAAQRLEAKLARWGFETKPLAQP
jgi:hypothetical protein